jgi:hypothetical protein
MTVNRTGVRKIVLEANSDGIHRAHIFTIEAYNAMSLAQYLKMLFRLLEAQTINRARQNAERTINAVFQNGDMNRNLWQCIIHSSYSLTNKRRLLPQFDAIRDKPGDRSNQN